MFPIPHLILLAGRSCNGKCIHLTTNHPKSLGYYVVLYSSREVLRNRKPTNAPTMAATAEPGS